MSLIELTQQGGPPPGEHERALLPAMVRNAFHALQAGVRLSWGDWLRFSPLERAAFVAAARRLEVERVTRDQIATSPLGLATVATEIDGGDSLVLLAAKAVDCG